MSASSPVKIAVVGTGLIGPRHAEAVLKDADAELVCIVDPSPAAEVTARTLGCPLFSSVKDMLASAVEPDAAIVCTPNQTHVSLSKELLSAGLHVLCEKPISVDLASGQELIVHADTCRRHLLIGHHRRFNRFVIAAKSVLPSLGRIIAVNGLWTTYKPPNYFNHPAEWRRLESAGPILINLVHEIDILQHLLGPIIRVYAERAISQRGYAAEEGAAIILRFRGGVVGTFLLSDAVPSPHSFEAGTGENPMIPYSGQDFYRIFGTEASLSVPDMTHWTYGGSTKSWTQSMTAEKLEVPNMKIPFELQIEHFVKVVRGQEPPSCPGKEALRALVVCEAVKKAIQDGSPVDIPEENF